MVGTGVLESITIPAQTPVVLGHLHPWGGSTVVGTGVLKSVITPAQTLVVLDHLHPWGGSKALQVPQR